MPMLQGTVFTRSLLGKVFTFDMLTVSFWLPRTRRPAVRGGGDAMPPCFIEKISGVPPKLFSCRLQVAYSINLGADGAADCT